jgi:autophagy-related protein 18
MPPPAPRALVLNASFNHDRSCLAVATTRGFQIIRLDTGELAYEDALGAVRVAEMLWSTSLVAVVGAGDDPRSLSPRTLRVLNTSAADRRPIADLSFRDAVLAVRLNRARLVVVTERRAIVHDAATLASLRAVETAPNPRGAVALAEDERVSLLALPSPAAPGVVLLIDALNLTVADEIRAHDAPVAALALTPDAAYLATASVKGTVVRVHRVAAAAGFGANDTAAFEESNGAASSSSSSSSPSSPMTFRRGVRSEAIVTLAFGPPRALGLRTDGVAREARAGPLLLLAAGARGAAHVYLVREEGGPSSNPAAAEAGATFFSKSTREDSNLGAPSGGPGAPPPPPRPPSSGGVGHALARAGSSLGAGLARRVASVASATASAAVTGVFGATAARKAADAYRATRDVALARLPAPERPDAEADAAARGGFGVAGVAQLLDARTGSPGAAAASGAAEKASARSRGGAFSSSSRGGASSGFAFRIFGVTADARACEFDAEVCGATDARLSREFALPAEGAAEGAGRGRREEGRGGAGGAGEGDANANANEKARSGAPSARWLEGEEVDGGEGDGRGAMAASISAGMAGSVFAESFPR